MPNLTRLRSVRAGSVAIATSIILVASVPTLLAHAVVYPEEAPTGAYQKYVLRVPNERGFPTSEVAITFPSGVRVISFDDVAEWTLSTTSVDDGATFTGATWTGTLGVGRFVEFGFIGVNPQEPVLLKWDVVQTYSDGLEVEWTGPVDSSTPASLTNVLTPTELGGADSPSSGTGSMLAGAALLLALISLGLAVRPRH